MKRRARRLSWRNGNGRGPIRRDMPVGGKQWLRKNSEAHCECSDAHIGLCRHRPDGPADGQAPGIARLSGTRVRHRGGQDGGCAGLGAARGRVAGRCGARCRVRLLEPADDRCRRSRRVRCEWGRRRDCSRRNWSSTSRRSRSTRARAFAARLRDQTGCGWVDAPVSGGPPASGHRHADGDGRRRRGRHRARRAADGATSPRASRTWARQARAWSRR